MRPFSGRLHPGSRQSTFYNAANRSIAVEAADGGIITDEETAAGASWPVAVKVACNGLRDICPRELHLVEALRTLRLIHYSAWIARRWDDPAFPTAFPWFGTQRYWQDQVLHLREQIAAMQEGSLWVV